MKVDAAARTRAQTSAVLAGLLLVGYCGLAFALGESYPLSPLGMFSRPQKAATRVVVRTQAGTLAEVTAFDEWSCGQPLVVQGVDTPLTYSAQDERVVQYIRENGRPPGAEERGAPVELVRLVFRIREPGGPLETETRPLAACRARERPR